MDIKLRKWMPILLFFFIICGNSAYATIQSHLNFQGFLVTSDGEPVTDGNYNLKISLWDGPSDSTDSKLWEESHTVSVTRGIYSVLLGDSVSFPNTMTFASQYYLGVQVSNEPIMKQDNGELIPLTSTWTSFRAKTSGGRCVNAVSQDYTITDDDDVVLGTGDTTIKLPSVSSFANRIFTIKKMDNTNTLSIVTSASEAIDTVNRGSGGSSLDLTTQQEEISVISDGTQWISIGVGTDSFVPMDQGGLNADVSGYEGAIKISGGTASQISISSWAEGILDDNDASARRSSLGLGSMATQASNSVDINGGAIDDTTIGKTTRSAGYFSDITVTSGINFSEGSLGAMAVQASNSVDINGGAIDNTSIGETVQSTAKFVTVTVSSTGYISLGPWRFKVDGSNNLIFQVNTTGSWSTKYTFTTNGD